MTAFAAPPEPNQQRSLVQDVKRAFAQSPYYLHRQLEVNEEGEAIVLEGRVDSFYHKQMAQEVVRSICRHATVVNKISVD